MSDLNAIHFLWSSAGTGSTIQIPRTPLINWQYSWILYQKLVSTASSWMLNNIVAQGGSGGAPIAVPAFCNQHVSPNCKTLFFMRRRNASINTTRGTTRCFSLSRLNRPIWWGAGPVLVFVYMEVASQMKRRAFDGIFVGRVPFLAWMNPGSSISAF